MKYALNSISRRKQKNIGSVLAIALGVTLLIGSYVGAEGVLNVYTADRLNFSGTADITVNDRVNIYMNDTIVDYIANSDDSRLDDVEVVSGRIRMSLSYYSSGQIESSILTNAIDPSVKGYGSFYDTNNNVIDEASLLIGNAIMVSDSMAELLNINIDDYVETSMPDALGGTIPLRFRVVGIFDDEKGRGMEGVYINSPVAYVSLNYVQSQQLPEYQHSITTVVIKFLDSKVDRSIENFNVDDKVFPGMEIINAGINATRDIVKQHYPYAYVSSEIVSAVEEVARDLEGISSVLNLFSYILNAVALLLIVNVQSMSLEDRRYQTAVLRAMGSSKGQIFRIFMIESVFVGIVGAFIGLFTGNLFGIWTQDYIGNLFGFKKTIIVPISAQTLSLAFTAGVMLSVLTTVVPAYHAAGKSITNELRGIKEEKVHKKGKKTVFLGFLLMYVGLQASMNVGEFWVKETWETFENQTDIIMGFGLTIFGMGLILTQIINRKLAINISGVSVYSVALFSLYVSLDWVKNGSGNNYLTIVMSFLIVGSAIIVINNFEFILNTINKALFNVAGIRGVSQVSTKSIIGKKSRLSLVFMIFSVILALNTFMATSSATQRSNLIDSYAVTTKGINIVVNSDVPSTQITSALQEMNGVKQVFAFRSVLLPMFLDNPDPNNTHFDMNKHLTFRRVVEVPETIINPNGNWDDESYLMHMEWTSEDQGYNYELTYGEEQHNNLSKTIFNDFFAERKINFQYNYTETIDDKEMVTDYRIEEQTAVIGGSWTNFNQPLYLQTNDENQPILPVLRVARALTLMGDVDLFGYSLLVTEGIADMLPAFDNIEGPNLFLLRTNYEYGSQKNIELAKNIEANLNNLDDVNSLSSELGVLIGANTRVTSEEFKAFWEREAAFWDFLGTYAEIGLILGAMGMIIIAARSVSERKREIGMMRSIGFSRREVMVSVALELSVVSVIGLIAGIITGILMSDSVFALIWRVPVVYPIDKFLIYILIVFGITVISAVLPGRNAARIPPSQALRYTG